MKFLFLLDPLRSRSRELRNDAILQAALESLGDDPGEEPVSFKVCAPGPETRRHAEHAMGQHTARHLIAPSTEEERHEEACEPLQRGSAGRASARLQYYRGEGPAAETLSALLNRIRSEAFEFDVVVSTGAAVPVEKAALAAGAMSARVEAWPGGWGRWNYFSFVRCRDARGVDPADGLALSHLKEAGLFEVPASIDQRLLGSQGLVNPFECKFAPLDESVGRAFRPDRRTAVVTVQSAAEAALTGGQAFDQPGRYLDRVLPPLLDAGWHCLLIREGALSRRYAEPWKDRKGVFLIDEAEENELKEERRKVLALLAQCDLVVTDNSPTGLEALIYERPACVLGRPFYAVDGVFPDLETVAAGEEEAAARREAGSLVRALLFRAWGTPFFGKAAAPRLYQRLRVGAELTREFADQPARWVQALQRRLGEPHHPQWLQAMRQLHAGLEQPIET